MTMRQAIFDTIFSLKNPKKYLSKIKKI